MRYVKLFDNYNSKDYEKISSVLYNELLYGHYSVFDFDEDAALWYMNTELFSMSDDINRIERIITSKLKSDRVDIDFFSNTTHHGSEAIHLQSGYYKVKVNEYNHKNLSIGLKIYNPNRQGIELTCVYAIIHKLKDEWFIVDFRGLDGYVSMISTTYYRCDQITGLIKFIKENFNLDIDV